MKIIQIAAGYAALAALITSTATIAQQNPSKPLWGTLTAGMTPSQVEEAYPSGSTTLGDGCRLRIVPAFHGAGLTSVKLRLVGIQWTAKCAHMVESSLIDKYGDPIERGSQTRGLYTGDRLAWKNGDVWIDLFILRIRGEATVTYGHEKPIVVTKPSSANVL